MLRTFHNQTSIIMCSYLPVFTSFNRTKGSRYFIYLITPQSHIDTLSPSTELKVWQVPKFFFSRWFDTVKPWKTTTSSVCS